MVGHNFVLINNYAGGNVDSKLETANIKTYLITILYKSTATPFRRHESQYQCFYCEEVFLLTSALKGHTTQKHGRMEPNESLRFWTEFNLTSNLMFDIKDLKCTMCNIKIAYLQDLKIHLSEKHNEFIPNYVLSNIICFKLADGVIRCFMCKKEFGYFSNLVHHMKSRTHAICVTCGEGFISKKRFAEHENAKCKPCSLCDIRFQSRKKRNNHVTRVHCKELKCDFCSQEFTVKMALARHIKNIHYKEKNGSCDICGKTFFNTHYMNIHTLSHSKIKYYECDVCKKRFMKKETMKLHKRIHDNDRRFICKVCGKSFIQWTSLHRHKSVHSNVRNFKCSKCNRVYKDKETMMGHYKRFHIQEEDTVDNSASANK